MVTLYIVGTPIGNLEDITKRALRILSEVDLILCEDTRVTRKLLEHYQIETQTLSYHQHSKLNKVEYITRLLKDGKNLALVSDAGTPGISDPGNRLISYLVNWSAGLTSKPVNQQTSELKIVPIPGSSALLAAASISGFPMDKFVFMGFPPVKKKRNKFFEEVANCKYPVIFYESPYRILKTLEELKNAFRVSCFRFQVVVCRELTKKFETIYRGDIGDVLKQLEAGQVLGEFVIVVEPK